MLACLAAALAWPAAGGGGAITASPARPTPLAPRCGSAYEGTAASTFWFRAADGTRLAGATLGQGRATVILATEFPGDLCGWLDYGLVLRKAGFAVFLFDFRGLGESSSARRAAATRRYASDVSGAVAEARRRGARKVLLVGASIGGAASILAATALRPPVAAVASLSGEAELKDLVAGVGPEPVDAVRRLHTPLLIMVSEHDRYLPLADARRLLRRAAAEDKHLAVYPGSYHGWNLLYAAPYRRKASDTLLRFLRAHA